MVFETQKLRLTARRATASVKIDISEQTSSVSPNFIHSFDATHLVMTVNAAVAEGVSSFAMIHDSFGAHACDIPKLKGVLREQFVKLYTENDPFSMLVEANSHNFANGVSP